MTHPGAQYLAELRESAKKATQGEWTAEKRHESTRHILAEVHGLVIAADDVRYYQDEDNAAHIANASPSRIAAIVEYVNQLDNRLAAETARGILSDGPSEFDKLKAELAAEKARADHAESLLAIAEERLAAGRWNIERDGDDILVCKGEHEKGEACEYERFVPVASLASEKARADAAEAEREDIRSQLIRMVDIAEERLFTIASLTEQLAEIGRAWVAVGHHEGIEISVNHDAAETWNALCALLDPVARATLSRLEKQEGEA